MSYLRVGWLTAGLVVTAVPLTGAAIGTAPRAVLATSPCGLVVGDPDPPVGEPELLGGTVRDAGTSSGISGATLKVYRCAGGEGVYVTSETTNACGYYEFDGLTTQKWYYIEAVMSGPLAGMSPASGTSNPTDPLGETSTTIDLTFE